MTEYKAIKAKMKEMMKGTGRPVNQKFIMVKGDLSTLAFYPDSLYSNDIREILK